MKLPPPHSSINFKIKQIIQSNTLTARCLPLCYPYQTIICSLLKEEKWKNKSINLSKLLKCEAS